MRMRRGLQEPNLEGYMEFIETKEMFDEALASGLGFLPSKAMPTYRFIVVCCTWILHDATTLLKVDHHFQIVREPEPISASSSQRLSPYSSGIISEDFRDLKNLERKYSTVITPEKSLPPEYERAFVCFWDNPGRASDNLRREDLRQEILFSKAFRSSLVRTGMEDSGDVRISFNNGSEYKLFAILFELSRNQSIMYCSPPDLVD
ncbi:hypothetical protein EAF04_001996 [Stromatinia cepivora]|nr:hypothetical protein EAF04_001996 [Stromatinia cepivora]